VRGDPDHDDSIRIIHKALDAGINFVDTSAGRRDDIVLATKAHGAMGDDPNHQGNSRRWLIREVEASQSRLQTGYIDLYQIHRSAADTDIQEMGALVWSPLAKVMLTGRYRKGQALPDTARSKRFPEQMSDERNLDALVSVTERTREIGLRLAVGARRSAILWQFLIEAVALSTAGGAIGVVFGTLGAVLVSVGAHWPAAVPLSAVLFSVAFSALVGVFFGYYPAAKASRLDPIVALRFE
jgi:aryl-alcohol dehydrogenase-like predicted oxidoreductase